MKTNIKSVITIGVLSLLAVVFIFGTQVFFNNKEINNFSEKCYENGGTPKVERDFLSLNYSFSCPKNN